MFSSLSNKMPKEHLYVEQAVWCFPGRFVTCAEFNKTHTSVDRNVCARTCTTLCCIHISYFIFINIHWGNFHANVISGGLSSVNKPLKYKSHLEGYYSF